ncbi:MAG: hypothetical protein ACOXZ0_07230 [Eubacteriales bacterium]
MKQGICFGIKQTTDSAMGILSENELGEVLKAACYLVSVIDDASAIGKIVDITAAEHREAKAIEMPKNKQIDSKKKEHCINVLFFVHVLVNCDKKIY